LLLGVAKFWAFFTGLKSEVARDILVYSPSDRMADFNPMTPWYRVMGSVNLVWVLEHSLALPVNIPYEQQLFRPPQYQQPTNPTNPPPRATNPIRT
jgi:hypothetical protein